MVVPENNKNSAQATRPLPKGSTLGVLGGGQLGMMFVTAARAMGYRTAVFDNHADSPASKETDRHFCAPYDDLNALSEFARHCDSVTFEFENIPMNTARFLSDRLTLCPSPYALGIAQDRIAEKTFLRSAGFSTANFTVIDKLANIGERFAKLAPPAIMKTARGGYDGKGQMLAETPQQARDAFLDLGSTPCVLEEKVALEHELSVIVARDAEGNSFSYPVAANEHRSGILYKSMVPAPICETLHQEAQSLAERLAHALNYCGVLGVEFFATEGKQLLINEFAPRPHNSGHYTIDACNVSQFEQQVRMMVGLKVAKARMKHPAVVMMNLLGDLWHNEFPDWSLLQKHTNLTLHLYGKDEARRGRKMGHFCLLGNTLAEISEVANRLHEGVSHHVLQADGV